MFGGERYVRERIIIRNGTITSKIEHLWVEFVFDNGESS
jgi:hypothetical protein